VSLATGSVADAFVPSDDELRIRETVATIANRYGPEYTRRCSEEERPPVELWDELAAAGYLGVNIPADYDGGGLGMTELAAVGEELAFAGTPLLLILVSPAIAGSVLARHGSPEQRERWLRGIGRGDLRMAFAITEPDAGSNTHNLATKATRVDGGFRLRGTKVFISGVEMAHALFVVARTGERDAATGYGRLSLFVVDVDAPGLERQQCTGIGRQALDRAAAYARERVVWDAPIGSHQGVAHPLAEAKIELELARTMTRKACALYDAGAKGAGEASNMAKFAAAEAGIKCVDRAIQTHGGNGVALEYGLADLWWGVRTAKIAPVSQEMILNYVAEHSLRLPRCQ
jgi:alkylation response protein AidB-like acyl-CoA dehydrogenase